MTPEQIRDIAIHSLEDLKGVDIVSIDVRDATSITDFMVICTGTSTRHISALAENVVVKAKEHHLKFVRTEGDQQSDWVLVDLGDVVVHLMLASARSFYSLEALWEPIIEIREQKV